MKGELIAYFQSYIFHQMTNEFTIGRFPLKHLGTLVFCPPLADKMPDASFNIARASIVFFRQLLVNRLAQTNRRIAIFKSYADPVNYIPVSVVLVWTL